MSSFNLYRVIVELDNNIYKAIYQIYSILTIINDNVTKVQLVYTYSYENLSNISKFQSTLYSGICNTLSLTKYINSIISIYDKYSTNLSFGKLEYRLILRVPSSIKSSVYLLSQLSQNENKFISNYSVGSTFSIFDFIFKNSDVVYIIITNKYKIIFINSIFDYLINFLSIEIITKINRKLYYPLND